LNLEEALTTEMLRKLPAHEVMARTGWGEARGDAASQSPVLWALMNRLRNRHRGARSMHDVALAPKQFSTWNANDPNRAKAAAVDTNDPIYAALVDLSQRIMSGQEADPTAGAEYYHTKGITPNWDFSKLEPAGEFGRHVFYRSRKRADKAATPSPAGD
jgi:N-acetylmuramoyl-L-alanine amidase